MPQMSNTWWLPMMLITSMTLLINKAILYSTYTPLNINKYYKKKETTLKTWAW